ncbi:histidinol-phosphate aminotransferase [Nocardia sp. GAS34]|uniref:Rv2231c family pyridoxal phosphate-dependent protein CobC n=1 Tax=unclassified Nocardia TaxID=2637762 RepID=UPI003D221984
MPEDTMATPEPQSPTSPSPGLLSARAGAWDAGSEGPHVPSGTDAGPARSTVAGSDAAAETAEGGYGALGGAGDPGEVDPAKLRHHGDVDARPGMLDFAVNVQGSGPPGWLRARLAARLGELGRYPGQEQEAAARSAVAARHGRTPQEVLLLAGAAEGFAMLPRLAAGLAAVVHPSFTEPELALREAGVAVTRVVLPEPYELDPALIPEAADLVVLGNPTNPTSVLHPARTIRALRRPGRLVVVDEAFADAVPGEPESLAAQPFEDVLVLRSLTKTWALAGLRCGYFLGPPALLARLGHGRAHWPLGTLQLEAIAATAHPDAVAESHARARDIAADRAEMIPRLRALGIAVHEPARAPFVLIRVPDAELLRKRLAETGIAVRRGDTFPGLGPGHLRLAVRPPAEVDRLIAALREVGL